MTWCVVETGFKDTTRAACENAEGTMQSRKAAKGSQMEERRRKVIPWFRRRARKQNAGFSAAAAKNATFGAK